MVVRSEMKKSIILFALFLHYETGICGKCLPKTVTEPCICDYKSKTIKCDTNKRVNVTRIFRKISENLSETEKYFNFFIIANSGVEELEDNAFADISFRYMSIINGNKLKRISIGAFNHTNTRIEVFEQTGRTELDRNTKELFASLNTLVNLVSLTLNVDKIESLPTKAFHRLTRLQELTLSDGQISFVANNAFQFDSESNETLIIDLQRNRLNGFSFDHHSFRHINRPIEFDLRENRLTFLNETIFKPFLLSDYRNIVNLRANPFDCYDCRMSWLVIDKHIFADQVIDIRCADFVSIFEKDLSEFSHCF